MTDRDTDGDSLTRAFDANRESVESLADRLDTADELLRTAVGSVRAFRGDADGPARERSDSDSGPTPNPSADPPARDAAARSATGTSGPTESPAADDAARLAGPVDADGDDVVAAVETAAELHREGALSDVTDAVSKEDAARAVEALLDAYGDPEVDGKMGYLAAVADGLTGQDEREAE